MPRPKKETPMKDPLAGIKVEKNEERNAGPLKLVLRLPVPKDTDASLSSDVFPGGESDGILQSDEDDDGSRTFLTNDEVEMIRESAGTPSLAKQFGTESAANSTRKKRKKKKFKLTMTAKPPKKGRKGEVESGGKETKKFKKNAAIDAAGIEREMDTDEKTPDVKSPSPVMVPDYSPLQFLLDTILKTFEKKDPDKFFMQPVTDEIAPNYSTTITNPMDFSTMRRKLDANEYKNLPEFKADVKLIAKNAMTYNDVGSIYYFAAKKLLNIADYLFSKEKLLFLQKTCSFMSHLNETDLGVDLNKPIPVKASKPPLANYACIVDDMSADEVLAQVSVAARAAATRLASRRPNVRTAFVSSRADGTATLKCLIPENVADDSAEQTFRLNDVVPKLKEGNPGMARFEEHPANIVVPYNYLDYGPFASFAPLYDSTWSTLSKEDSDLLIATYGGDETCVQYVESIKSFVEDSGDYLVRLVDGVLDSLTDGEHSKSLKKLSNKNSGVVELPTENESSVGANADQNYSFIDPATSDVDRKLAEAGALLSELRNAQYERLSQPPPFVLTETPGPSIIETNLAHQLLNNLQFLSSQVEPGQLTSTEAVRTVMAGGLADGFEQTTDSNGSDDYDMDVFREFFQVENGT